jgi:hypothetical protein
VSSRFWVSVERLVDQLERELEEPATPKPKLGWAGHRIREPSANPEDRAKREARLTNLTAIHYRRKSA